MLQTPSDDLPFVALSMSEFHNKQQKNGLDWVCLLFTTSAISLDIFVEEESFPSDFEGLSPDYMFLPVRILCWQVEQVRDGLTKLMERVLNSEKGVAEGDINTLKGAKMRLFERGKEHLRLRNRWLFATRSQYRTMCTVAKRDIRKLYEIVCRHKSLCPKC
jgi:hypothetical protein